MLEFVNTIFLLLGDFVNMLWNLPLLEGLSFGQFLVGVIIFVIILSFLFKGWIDKTVD